MKCVLWATIQKLILNLQGGILLNTLTSTFNHQTDATEQVVKSMNIYVVMGLWGVGLVVFGDCYRNN